MFRSRKGGGGDGGGGGAYRGLDARGDEGAEAWSAALIAARARFALGKAARVARIVLPLLNSILATATFALILVFFLQYGKLLGASIQSANAVTMGAADYLRSSEFKVKATEVNATLDQLLRGVREVSEPQFVHNLSSKTLDLISTTLAILGRMDPDQLTTLLDGIISVLNAVAPTSGAGGGGPGIVIKTVIGKGGGA